ncbi:MAG TPA: type I phosphomannose isomerase catalytic subunit [Anaerolineales bacterium]|jgi:mannose-6-phosphate isomerase|nr:type I phosphomannose isomerase catalytic subunit [Anaerolineales bacterium]
MTLNSFLKLTPSYRDYVWGGDRLRPGHYPTAEAWIVWEDDVIESGPLAGKTLGEAAKEYGTGLLGTKINSHAGTRFPVLIKLLDCAQWLSLQVHPNNELAAELEGPGQSGKTEAWHILAAEPEAKLIAGLQPNTPPEELAESIRKGTVIDHVQYVNVKPGDTVFVPAGTLHALGPGLLVYEVQQTSDWTYRVYDWGRPATEKRPLHIEKSIRATRADFTAPLTHLPTTGDGTRHVLIECEFFTLELLSGISGTIELDTAGKSFHAITVIEGKAVLKTNKEEVELEKFQTAVIPAQMGTYQFQPLEDCRALKSSA